ncbi:hypothetical protein KGQ34_00395 [Patescibacteria group bacterium]|nr:hypothetical protein [Patescibacteria group bacterium]
MRKIVLYGAVVGAFIGTLSGFLEGPAYGIILGIAVFIFYTAICSMGYFATAGNKKDRKQ